MNDKTYLADSVGELQAELDTVRMELEQVKLNNARFEAVNQQQGKDLERMRAAYTERNTECIQLRVLLEQMGTMLTMGLSRYRRQNMARDAETAAAKTDDLAAAPRAPSTQVAQVVQQQPARVHRPGQEEPKVMEMDLPPLFLQKQRPGVVRTDLAAHDSRLPSTDFRTREQIAADELEQLGDNIQSRRQT